MVRLASLFRWTRPHQKAFTNRGSDPDKSAQAQAPAPQLESAIKQRTQHIGHTAVRDVASNSGTLPQPSSPNQATGLPKAVPSRPDMEVEPEELMKELTKQESRLSQKSQKSHKSHKSHKSQKKAVVANPQPSSQAELPAAPKKVGALAVTQPSGRPQTQDTSVSSNTGLVSEQNGARDKDSIGDSKLSEAPLPTRESKSPTASQPSRARSEKRKSILRFLSKREAPTRSGFPPRRATFPVTKPTNRARASPSSISPTPPTIIETSEKDLEMVTDFRIAGRKWRDSDNDSLYCY